MLQKLLKEMFQEINESTRNQWIQNELESLPAGIKFLDAGAGQCKWKKNCSHLTYVSQDFCQYEGTGNEKGLQTGKWDTNQIDIVSDIIKIPVKDEEFDAILCSEVLEHVAHPELAIKELSRITKRGGVLLLTAPFNSLTHFAPYHYSSGFNIYWYEKHLQENGYEIIEIKCNGDYFTYMDQELGRLVSVIYKYTNKKSFCIKLLALLLRISLKKFIKMPNNSSELQCHGYFVKAIKK